MRIPKTWEQNTSTVTTSIPAESSNFNSVQDNLEVSVHSKLMQQEDKPDEKIHISTEARTQLCRLTYTSKREIERNRFDVGDEIGSGNFGKVYMGQLTGLYHTNSKTTVAIKSISGKVNETELETLLCEVQIMSNVHPHLNLVSMVASCSSELKEHGKLWLLLEYCQYGDLKSFLVENKTKILSGNDNDAINTRCLIKWAYDIANGMEYLAKNQIMHGDLAARNILMDDNPLKDGYPVAKVSDFGLSKKFNDYSKSIYQKETRLFVPWRWMALEYLVSNYFTISSDVWSFGILFWEMLSFGKIPYGHQGYDEVLEKLQIGYRLPCPKEIEGIVTWHTELHRQKALQALFDKLSNACFVAVPTDRGTFSDVVEIIRKELSPDELLLYTQMKDNYQSTRTTNYLKLHKL